MPLIIMTGYPSSGKTQRSQEIKAFFEERCAKENKRLRIHVVNDEMLGISKTAYKGNTSVRLRAYLRISTNITQRG